MRVKQYIREAVEKYGKKDDEHVKEDFAATGVHAGTGVPLPVQPNPKYDLTKPAMQRYTLPHQNKNAQVEILDSAIKMLAQIGKEAQSIERIFRGAVENISPLGNRLLGETNESVILGKKSDSNDMYIVINNMKPNLKNLYYLINAIDYTIGKAKIISYSEQFINAFNLQVNTVDNVLKNNNNEIVSLSIDCASVPVWFNNVQYKDDSSTPSPNFILQILYYECRKVTDSFFKLANSFQKNEPKINTTARVVNLLTKKEVIASIDNLGKIKE
ncbi:MAG: hypothetical protein FWC26_04505 [Fibromonadales bacterium]|nr:hypothetical protein [Fibromonadales bacterium]